MEVEMNKAKQLYERCKETDQVLSTGEIISAKGDLEERCWELQRELDRHEQPK